MELEKIFHGFLDEGFARRGHILEFLNCETRLLRFDSYGCGLFLLFGLISAGIGSRPFAATIGIRIPKVKSSILTGFAPPDLRVTPPAVGILKSSVNAGH